MGNHNNWSIKQWWLEKKIKMIKVLSCSKHELG